MRALRQFLAWACCCVGAVCVSLGWLAVPVLLQVAWWWGVVGFLGGVGLLWVHSWLDDTW